jgi:hypothetical protein
VRPGRTFSSYVLAFAAAVFAGTAAAMAVPVLVCLALVLESGSPDGSILRVLAFFVGLAFPIVLLGSLVIGVPAALLLRALRRESGGAYVLIGAAAGFLVPAGVVAGFGGDAEGLVLLGPVASFSGGVTAAAWWALTRPRRRKSSPLDLQS